MPSLGRGAAARLVADLSGVAIGAAVAVITARWLGPAGRGILSALLYIGALFMAIASLGLNEAAVVMVGQRRVSMPAALSANIGCVALAGSIAAALSAIVAAAQIRPDSPTIWLAVAVAAASVLVGTVQNILAGGLMMTERIVQASIVIGASSAVTLAATCLLVIVVPIGVLGAVLATACGGLAGLLLAGALLPRGFRLRPRWDRSYLRPAVRYGVRLQAAQLITLLAGRLDLLIAFSLLGAAAAGQYTIALTLAGIVAMAPFALSYAAFPRLAYVSASEAAELTLLVWRRSLVVGLAALAALAALSPFAIPFLFGRPFAPAVVPTLVLLVGSLFASGQWTLARAAGARGYPGLLLRSFGLALVVMVGLDFALMPPFGLVGAAAASTLSNLAGLAVCVIHFHRYEGLPVSRLWPRFSDVRGLVGDSLRLVRGLAATVRGVGSSASDTRG